MRIAAEILTAAAAALGLAACNTSGCTENQNSIPLAGFYSSATEAQVSLDSVGVYGVGAPGDSLLLSPGTSASQIYLPLNASAASTSFVFTYRGPGLDNPLLNDTLTFVYDAVPYFAGEECGAMYVYDITRLDVTDHLIDSVGLLDRHITNVDIESLKIFFRTAEPEPEPEQ